MGVDECGLSGYSLQLIVGLNFLSVKHEQRLATQNEISPTRRDVLALAAVGAACAALNGSAGAVNSVADEPTGESIYLTDLDQCQPSSALTRKPKRHQWRMLDFEAERASGVMLVVGQNTSAPEIRYALNRKGWFAISIGLRSVYGDSKLQVRLSADKSFTILHHRMDPTHLVRIPDRYRIDELFFKAAELDGQDIVFRQLCLQLVPKDLESVGNSCNGVWIAYIRLVPLSSSEVEAIQRDRSSRETQTLFAHNDASSDHYTFRPTTADEIRRRVEPYRDTDFSRLYWEGCQGDRCNYFTKIGLMPSDDKVEDAYRVGDRLAAESWRILQSENIDPFRVALEHAHEMGLEFHGALRATGFHFPAPEDEWNIDGIYDRFPNWRGTDRAGLSTPRLSYAFPEFRSYVISLLKEIAAYPIDGVCMLYNRRPPFIEYEAPVVEGYMAQFGHDPRTLDERYPQWLEWRSTFMTQFMREVRAAMDAVGKVRGMAKRLEISAVVMGNQAENDYYGLDLQSWVREGIVDTLIPYTSVTNLNSAGDAWVNPSDAAWFQKITENSACRLALNVMPRQLPAETYFTRAHHLYENGIRHLFFWDCNDRHDYSTSWGAIRQLGHRKEIAKRISSGSPNFAIPGMSLKKLGDWDMKYATPG